MPDRPQDRASMLISEEAADWLVYLREGNLRISERRRYVRWLKQSPAHIAEILRLATLDGLLRKTDLEGILPSPEEVDQQDHSAASDAATLEAGSLRRDARVVPVAGDGRKARLVRQDHRNRSRRVASFHSR
jgi:ferric-dicitrate binding protein FerR (iron transport regulator)